MNRTGFLIVFILIMVGIGTAIDWTTDGDVRITSPANNTNITTFGSNYEFFGNITTATSGIVNVSFYHNFTGTWHLNQSVGASGNGYTNESTGHIEDQFDWGAEGIRINTTVPLSITAIYGKQYNIGDRNNTHVNITTYCGTNNLCGTTLGSASLTPMTGGGNLAKAVFGTPVPLIAGTTYELVVYNFSSVDNQVSRDTNYLSSPVDIGNITLMENAQGTNHNNFFTIIEFTISNSFTEYSFNITVPLGEGFVWGFEGCAEDNTCGFNREGNYTLHNNRNINETLINLNFLDNSGDFLTENVNIVCPSVSVSTLVPSQYNSSFIGTFTGGADNATTMCNFTTSSGKYNNLLNRNTFFEWNTTEYNYTMTGKSLNLSFFDWNNNEYNVSGYWWDNSTEENFTGSSLTIPQENLTTGYVGVYFGNQTGTLKNYTGMYEYLNQWITQEEENITVITSNSSVIDHRTIWIKVTDDSGNLINDALVKGLFSNPYQGGDFQLFSQRLTGTSVGKQGMTYFITDVNQDIILQVSKSGFTPVTTAVIDINAYEYTETNPLTINLDRLVGFSDFNLFFWTNQRFYNRSSDLIFNVYAPYRDSIYALTNYSTTQAIGTLNNYDQATLTLISGTHFDDTTTATDDINLTLYVDGSVWGNYIIEYETLDKSRFNIPAGVGGGAWIRLLGLLGLITISSVLGFIFKKTGEEDGSGEIGVTSFMIGTILIGIFISGLGFLTAIGVVYFIMLTVRRYISE